MEFVSGGKRISVNEVAVKAMSYEQLQETFKGQFDWQMLAKELGIKPTPKKKKTVQPTED